MKTLAIFLLLSLITFQSPIAQAAKIKFDVNNLNGFFSGLPLNGSFILDTDSQLLEDVSLSSNAGSFTSGFAIDNPGNFGIIRDTAFLLSGDAELLFEVDNFDRLMPNLAIGQSIMVTAFISQADDFNDSFVNTNPFGINNDLFNGPITISRLAEVSAPAGLLALMIAFSGLFFWRRSGKQTLIA